MLIEPAIIVVAYNRPHALRRLLNSISQAWYPEDVKVPMCLCIDYQDSEENRQVVEMAHSFEWLHGPKEVIHQNENLGLKEHVLKCGDLSIRFGSIIMLEDDLFVSPSFYDYSAQALEFYNDAESIGGISLYNHKINFVSRAPFQPIEDGSDVYYLQIASSWGQAWNKNQWLDFKNWLVKHPVVTTNMRIPKQVENWPNKSWLKHFIAYLSETRRFFVYPRSSLSTNFGDSGENNAKSSFFFQVPVLLQPKAFSFSNIQDGMAKYDAYFDLLPEVIIYYNNELKDYDFVNNLSGLKQAKHLNKEWVLLCGRNQDAVKNYGLKMKPIELNVFHNIPGNDISVVPKNRIVETAKTYYERKQMYDYKYGSITPREKVQNVLDTLVTKLTR